jgi:intracellular septation protein
LKNLLYALRPLALDLASTIFFVALWSLTHNLILATAVGIGVGVSQVAYALWKRKPIDSMQWMSLGLVVVFGTATLLTNDPRFVMVKPTLIYTIIGAAMLQPDWMRRYMPPRGQEFLSPNITKIAGWTWAGLMFATAGANIFVALTMSEAAWRSFILIFPTVSKLVLFALTYATLRLMAGRKAREMREAEAAAAATSATAS